MKPTQMKPTIPNIPRDVIKTSQSKPKSSVEQWAEIKLAGIHRRAALLRRIMRGSNEFLTYAIPVLIFAAILALLFFGGCYLANIITCHHAENQTIESRLATLEQSEPRLGMLSSQMDYVLRGQSTYESRIAALERLQPINVQVSALSNALCQMISTNAILLPTNSALMMPQGAKFIPIETDGTSEIYGATVIPHYPTRPANHHGR